MFQESEIAFLLSETAITGFCSSIFRKKIIFTRKVSGLENEAMVHTLQANDNGKQEDQPLCELVLGKASLSNLWRESVAEEF